MANWGDVRVGCSPILHHGIRQRLSTATVRMDLVLVILLITKSHVELAYSLLLSGSNFGITSWAVTLRFVLEDAEALFTHKGRIDKFSSIKASSTEIDLVDRW